MGGFDGVTESNTALFERCLNWTGVLVEANPFAFEHLKTSGRVHADLVHAAPTCNRSGFVRMMNHKFTSASLVGEEESKTTNFKNVTCVPLTGILKSLGRRHVDFFSLDVEGSEDLVLSTVHFERLSLPMLLVESVNRQCQVVCPKRERVRTRMASHGYFLRRDVSKSDLFWSPAALQHAGNKNTSGVAASHEFLGLQRATQRQLSFQERRLTRYSSRKL
jgi:FkbM family methyltransferase